MSGLTKTMLGLTIASAVASGLFLSGIVNVSDVPGFYVVFPLAAVFYGMFLICWMLQNEVAKSDAERRKHRRYAAPDNDLKSTEPVHGGEHPVSRLHDSIKAVKEPGSGMTSCAAEGEAEEPPISKAA